MSLVKLILPTKLKELVNLYNSVENKCIVTARTEEVRNKIEETLNKLGLEYPNYGLYMYPRAKHYQVEYGKEIRFRNN
jgi:protoheme ferro-lyase